MDTYLLKAAVLYALSATSRTSTAVDDFLHIASFASPDLDPLAYELFDLRAPLERLADPDLAIPRPLLHPVLAIVRASGDALARIDTLLQDCTAESSCEVRWNAVRPKAHELKAGLCTCRRALQLALEVLNLAAAKDDDTDTLATYLDQDTSRVLALIRRTLQHVQDEDQADDLYHGLRSSLDEIRLLVQDMCNHRDESKLAVLQMAASRGSSNAPSHSYDTSTLVSEPQDVLLLDDQAEADAPAPSVISLRPAKKLTSAFAWSRRSKLRSLSTTSNSATEKSTTGDGALSFIDGDDAVPTTITTRQASHRSDSSHASRSSSRGGAPRGAVAPSNASLEVLPPALPPRNPRRYSMRASMDCGESFPRGFLPSPPTPFFDVPNFPAVSMSGGSLRSRASGRSPASPLPLFAISPPDKIIIDPADVPANWGHPSPRASSSPSVRLSRAHLISPSSSSKIDKAEGAHASTVFFVDTSPASYLLASKHGDKTIKIHGLPQGNLQASLKVNFYIQMQDRTRDFFVTSHAFLSETRSLLAMATRFGDTLEVWNWALHKRVQTFDSVNRWAVAAACDIYETRFRPLACYREVEDAVYLYPVAEEVASYMRRQDVLWGPTPNSSKQKPFGNPTILSLRDADLPWVPKLPELAYSSTAALLVAATGPRSARPGHSPPEHGAMLMAWDLRGPTRQRPSYFCMPAHHKELDTALPCGLAAHGDFAVSVWIPHHVRVTDSPGAWQVEHVYKVPSRFVLVWNMSDNTTSVFPIPNENTVACISPDCRYVAYRQATGKGGAAPGGGGGPSLVILDALRGGRELWRTPMFHEDACDWFLNPARISCLSFSSDGGQLIVGDVQGSVGVYDVMPSECGGHIDILGM